MTVPSRSSTSSAGHTHESVINAALADLFQERAGLRAEAEVTQASRARPDVVVWADNGPVIVETEYAPARSVHADALARLGMRIDGETVSVAFAASVPVNLRAAPQAHLADRLALATLEWREWRADGTSGPQVRGTVDELAQAVRSAEAPVDDLDQAVELLEQGAQRAGARLFRAPATLQHVADVFRTAPSDEVANMGALVIINAMMFHERLTESMPGILPVGSLRYGRRLVKTRLLDEWDKILAIDYYPIFRMARDVADQLPLGVAPDVLDRCFWTAERLLGMAATRRHDLAGRIFNRLIADRKFLAAFYTKIPTATLVAGLALEPSRWPDVDWSNPDSVRRLTVIDPACGTGTLLMACYQQLADNARRARLADGETSAQTDAQLHRLLIEDVIQGTDVVQAAIHLTAATLAAASPSIAFRRMNLHTLPLGADGVNGARLGSLDWLTHERLGSLFSGAAEQVSGQSKDTDNEAPIAQRPCADLVIMNPPYTRHEGPGDGSDTFSTVFGLFRDQDVEQQMSRALVRALRGTPANQRVGLASAFVVLADRLVREGGRIAFVLPVSAVAGAAWAGVRELWADRYDVEHVLSVHDPEHRSLSEDTDIAEVLLVARRLGPDEAPTGRVTCVNLRQAPAQVTDALAVLNAVRAVPAVQRVDGPPTGGSPLMVGGEQWGELVDSPIGATPLPGARWRSAEVGQRALALADGVIWSADGTRALASIPIAQVQSIASVSPHDGQIHKNSIGVFDAFHGFDGLAQFPALWRHRQAAHRSAQTEPNARLSPKPGRDHARVWAAAGHLHLTRDIRYNSQRVATVRTVQRTLGVRAWYTLKLNDCAEGQREGMEAALALWCNSTFGLLCHASQANPSQLGRGQGSRTLVRELPTLNVLELEPWQLAAAASTWRELARIEFQSFHRSAVDASRIELDRMLVQNVLGLGSDGEETAERLRRILAAEPSIHGSKAPALG